MVQNIKIKNVTAYEIFRGHAMNILFLTHQAENSRRTALEEFSIKNANRRHEQACTEILGARHEKK
jgi:hypothetical protein